MRTMVQDQDCDYDIDDGVYFKKEDLKDNSGAFLDARSARVRVKEALKDERLAFDAVVKSNCVRQMYPAGYHIDIPVYRKVDYINFLNEPAFFYELASGDDWVQSDARRVTKWFNDAVGSQLKFGEADSSQLRRVTKLSKKMARSRKGWKPNTASGICITKLVVDHFVARWERDDDSLRETWKAIRATLAITLRVGHPVYADKNIADDGDETVAFFRDCLISSLKTLEVLDHADCSQKKARAAWDNVFNTSYFSARPDQGNASKSSLLRPATVAGAGLTFPNKPVVPNKSPGFA